MTKADRKTSEDSKANEKEDQKLSKELESTFPASDPPASTQPGSGVTGPEVVKAK